VDLGGLDLHEVADVDVLGQLRAGAEAGEGPTVAPRLTWQPSRWEKARMRAPLSTVTPGPKTTLGSIVASRPT
jgi:hypothetical protein